MKTLPIPSHYNPENAAKWAYRPDMMSLLGSARAWAKTHGVKPAGSDKKKVLLLLIDEQKDFCFPEGTLYVGGRSGRGAIEDSKRVAEFMYRNAGVITDTAFTLDTHFFAQQIFFPSFWVDVAGNHPSPFREVLTEEIRSGKLKPNPAIAWWLCEGNYGWLMRQVMFYTEQLEKAGKYKLFLWPPHCLIGSDGYALVGVIFEAIQFHALMRGAPAPAEIKGANPLSENYSVLAPEVLGQCDGGALYQRNVAFIEKLMTSDVVVIAGQASSHCVKSSIDDLLTEIVRGDAKLARKVYILTDCTSSVTIPDGKGGFIADYTPQAEAAFQRFADAGMNLVKSTDPIESWSGIVLA